MSPPVTCADKLRDLNAKLWPAPWKTDTSFGHATDVLGDGGQVVVLEHAGDDAEPLVALRNALPEIAAVIEAAEKLELGWNALWPSEQDRLSDALAALSARLGDVTSQQDGAS